MEPSKQFCTSCGCFRPTSAFLLNKQGKRLKTCFKHNRKRALPDVEQWDSFLYEIKTWSQPEQTDLLDIKYTFDLDQLPVKFGHTTENKSDNASGIHEQNQAIGLLVDLIREAGKHRFRLLRSRKNFDVTYDYCCCQDSSHAPKSRKTGKRDRRPMERFPCNSKLSMKPDLTNRRLKIVMRHHYHIPYSRNERQQEVSKYSLSQCLEHSSAEIYPDLQVSENRSVDKDKPRNTNDEKSSDEFISAMAFIVDILKEQKEVGNTKMLEVFKASNTENLVFAAEVQQLKGLKTMPENLTQYKHPATIYYGWV
ncbi:hypothetical protein K3495_g3150 [Podosphaera aphanis]|nr:hypothetical protein K3495_g3150 [Podosphaera aphanis]